MGPSIILDKSALQSFSRRSIFELGRYFYTNVTPTLLHEILADLKLNRTDLDGARAKVAEIANKVIPFDAITNAPYHWLCFGELSGVAVPMQRRPIVAGGQTVTTADGRSGSYIGVQPENEAILRWCAGAFSQSDLDFAVAWREAIAGMSLEAKRQVLPKPTHHLDSLADLATFVDSILSNRESQAQMLDWLLDLLVLPAHERELVRLRWRNASSPTLVEFAPYSHYCLRINFLFLLGMSHRLFGTRNSNVIDIEYLYYMPFAFIFCSGDKFLAKLASLVLRPDQTFVVHDELRSALNDVALRRKEAQDTGGRDAGEDVHPADDSLISRLWIKHRGRLVPRAKSQTITPERSAEIMNQIKPVMDAMDKAARQRPQNQRFPS